MDLAREFTVGHREVGDLVHRLADEVKETQRELRRVRDALLDAEAAALWHQAALAGDVHIVKAYLPEGAAQDLKHLAQRFVERPRTVALLGGGGAAEKGHFTFARSDDVKLHMGSLVRRACQIIGGGGGGRPEFAQGGGPLGERVTEALDEAFDSVVAEVLAAG